MNVKAGDVAIIIKGRWPNVGRIVYVTASAGDRDYSRIGCGMLPCWFVESLGGDLDTDNGPSSGGHIPDIALRRLPGITREQAEDMRKTKADADFKAALADLALILAPFAETLDAEGRGRTVATARQIAADAGPTTRPVSPANTSSRNAAQETPSGTLSAGKSSP